MSENLDLVRSIYAEWEAGDFTSAAWADPDIEFVIPEGPDQGVFRGLPAMAQAWRAFLKVWDDYRVEVDEYRVIDPDRVLVFMNHGGLGNSSGLNVERLKTEGANLFHIRDAKVTRLVIHWDRDHALADLGLAE
jgi:ketosteroid isomerase-like protein